MSHRMLMGAALASGKSTVHNVLWSNDIECTTQVLSSAGAIFERKGQSVDVQGMAVVNSLSKQVVNCYMHESGTSCRLLMAILAAKGGRYFIHGAKRLHERPVGALVEALTSLGVQITYEQEPNFLPINIVSKGFVSDNVHINIDESSQYLSGLLLAAACSTKGLSIYLEGHSAVSWPYVTLTLKSLHEFGIQVQAQEKVSNTWQNVDWRFMQEIVPKNLRFIVPSAQYNCGEYTVEGDWSAASYFLAAGVVGQKEICITGLNKNSAQGDKAMLDVLTAMQANYEWQEENVIVRPSKLSGIEVDMSHCPDLVPTVAMLAAFAKGSTIIHNVKHLRIKECDRIAAPAQELKKLGVKVDVFDDGLQVQGLGCAPVVPKNTVFATYNDHRMAMSCALFGLNGQAVQVDDWQVVQKSFPNFWELWGRMI